MHWSLKLIAIGFAAALGGAGAVAAGEYRLTYTFSFGSVLEMDVTGAMQEDGETVVVSAVEAAWLDGEAGPALPFVTSIADLVQGGGDGPVLTLSGENNDFTACSDESCVEEFITFDGVMQIFGTPGVFTSTAYGKTYSGGENAGEVYDPANYALRER